MSQDRRQAGLGLRPSLYLSQKNKPRARPFQHEAQGHAQQAENRIWYMSPGPCPESTPGPCPENREPYMVYEAQGHAPCKQYYGSSFTEHCHVQGHAQ